MSTRPTSNAHNGTTCSNAEASTRSKQPRRSAVELRRIATALEIHPIPTLTKKEIAFRWSVGADTLRKILRACGVIVSHLVV